MPPLETVGCETPVKKRLPKIARFGTGAPPTATENAGPPPESLMVPPYPSEREIEVKPPPRWRCT